MRAPPLILASASPRRRRILEEIGVPFEVVAPEVEELLDERNPRRTVAENALRKNRWCSRRFPDRWVLAADTTIDFEGRCIGKPASLDEAMGFLRTFSGKRQVVLTGIALSLPGAEAEVRVVESAVVFRTLDEATIREYLARVDPLDKAGAYDIDQVGDLIIASYRGSHSNIMGLPRGVVREWLKAKGLTANAGPEHGDGRP